MSEVFKIIDDLLSNTDKTIEIQSISDLQYTTPQVQTSNTTNTEGEIVVTGHTCESCGKLVTETLHVE